MVNERIQRRIERLLDQIDTAEASSDWQEVVNLARDVLAIDEENREALAYLQTAERRLGNQSGLEGDSPPSGAVAAAAAPPTNDSAQPASFSDGRYQVTRFLGEGGKKMVYLAQDTLLDRDVAFALIKTDGLDDVSRTRISREAQAMGRLGSHPHIVTVFDLGEHENQPFMVVELLGGGDVEGVLEDAEGGKLSLEQAISIAIETCRGLEFAHSRGIIHRDLKPGNVWLTEDGIAKIGDFGLAVAMDRSRLTAEGMMVGTVSYMPPEQAMGGEVTPRADLYSLGAMLYEMVCGRPPFLGDDNIAIIGQHINTPPVAPTWHRSDCPRPLEALIMRLLSKDPSERPESASDVLAALEAVDVSPSDQSITEPEVAVNVLDSLAGDVFVGRQREMDDLKAALEDALGGRGRMVTLVGEPGIGKTRTAQELATYAGLRGAQVLWGRCYEEQGVPPYWPWVQAIRSYVRERDPDQLSAEMGSGAGAIAEIVSDVQDRLPGLSSPPQMDSPEAARFRLFDSITTFLKAASQSQPMVMILDDLHWSDQPSLALMQFVVREITGARLLLVGTYRDVELNRQHPLAEALGSLTRERLFERVLLRGLSHEDVDRFIEVTSGISPPPALVDSVHTQTEGNPLFVTEVVRLLVQEGGLESTLSEGLTSQANEGQSWAVRIPEGVREVLGRRLNQLSARCNEVLTVASVVGREFEFRQMETLTDDLTEDMLLDVLEEGLNARVIEEMPTSVGRYQFTHALIQETLMDELSLTRRVRLHARIAETLEELYANELESRAAELAHHFTQAEAVLGIEKLVTYSLLAGVKSLGSNAHEDALIHYDRALNRLGEASATQQVAEALFGRARALIATVEMNQGQVAVDTMRKAFDMFVDLGQLTDAVAVAIQRTGMAATTTGMSPMIEEAFQFVEPDSTESGHLNAQYAINTFYRDGDNKPAQAALEQAISIAVSHEDESLEMFAMGYKALMERYELRFEESISSADRVVQLSETANDSESLFRALVAKGNSLMFLGMGNQAETQLKEGIAVGNRIRSRIQYVRGLHSIARITIVQGDWDKAKEFVIQITEQSPMYLPGKLFNALIRYHLGSLDRLPDELDDISSVPGNAGLQINVANLQAMFARTIDDPELLDSIARFAAPLADSNSNLPDTFVQACTALALVAEYRDDKAMASEHYLTLSKYPGIITEVGISTDRMLGILTKTMGQYEDATRHFEDAVAFCKKAGYRPELAWSLHDYAVMLLDHDEPDDQQKATSMLDESLQISTDLGMRPLMERVLSRRDILKA